MSEAVSVVINGELKQVPRGLNMPGLLAYLGISTSRVAIERNLDILPQSLWDETQVSAGDRYEIVHLVGGG